MALELSPRPEIIDRLRALATLQNDAGLMQRVEDFERALADFFCEPPRLSAVGFTAVNTAFAQLCLDRTGEAQHVMQPAEFTRIRAAALALNRPREARVH